MAQAPLGTLHDVDVLAVHLLPEGPGGDEGGLGEAAGRGRDQEGAVLPGPSGLQRL